MRLALALATLAFVSPARANEPVCHDYTQALGEDRSLFDGFILGYVSAKFERRQYTDLNSAALKVKQLVNAYCLQRPGDPVSKVVALYADTVSHFAK